MRWLLVVALLGCGKVTEDKVYVRPLAPGAETGLDCEVACAKLGLDFDSVNYCTVATADVKPYLACKMEVVFRSHPAPDEVEEGIPLPSGLDPATRGEVPIELCDKRACEATMRVVFDDRALERITVKGCRVPERPPALATSKFLVCSIRTKTDAMVAFQ